MRHIYYRRNKWIIKHFLQLHINKTCISFTIFIGPLKFNFGGRRKSVTASRRGITLRKYAKKHK